MSLVLVTGPTVEPLTVAEARARLNIGSEVSDAVLNALISASRQMIDGRDGWLGRAINTQTWDLVLDHFPGSNFYNQEKGFYPQEVYQQPYLQQMWGMFPAANRRFGIKIPLPPLQSVVSVTYTDAATNAPLTVDPATYVVNSDAPSDLSMVIGSAWPTPAMTAGSVKLRFIAGYGSLGTDVPETIRTAICLQVSHLRSLSEQNLFLSGDEMPGVERRTWTVSPNAGAALDSAVMALLNPLRVWM